MADCTGQSRNTVYIFYGLKKKIKKFLGCIVYAGGTKLSSHPAEKEEEKTAETQL